MLSNHVTLIGHLGADPRTLTTHDGDLFTAGSIAISRRYTNRSGSTVDDTQWFGFVAFGSKAERILTSLRRGDRVCLEGRLTCRSYTTATGEQRQSVQVQVTHFEQLPKLSARRAALVELIAEAESVAAFDSAVDAKPAATQALEAPTAAPTVATQQASAKTTASAKTKSAVAKTVQLPVQQKAA